MIPYSYHTFVLPFIWNVGGKDMDDFCKPFCKSPHWRCTDIEVENKITPNENIRTIDDVRSLYAEYQYYNPAARRAIYGFGSGVVSNFSFNPISVRNKGKYIIQKDEKKYVLFLNGIRLKVYNTGVALFIIECENPSGDEFYVQNNMAAVKDINDYGRRISLPFLPKDDGFSLCADKLTIEIDGVGTFEEDYKEFGKSVINAEDIYTRVSLTHICDFIKKIIGYGTNINFSSNPKKNLDKDTFYIYSALDDRMFVICLVVGEENSKRYTKSINGEYPYERSEEYSKDLYEFAFVDRDGECTCPNQRMRDDLLEKHIYKRWIDYGSVFLTSHQSFVCATNHDPTINSFLTIYCEMCYLCLAQRASLINFQREITTISERIEKNGKKIKTSTIGKILNLEERFVAFLDQLSLFEITSQEQGIELYEMVKEFFFIEKEREFLSKQMESLYSAANTNLDFRLNKGGTIVGLIALVMASVSFLADSFGLSEELFGKCSPLWKGWGIVSVVGIVGLAVFAVVMIKYRRKK